MTAEPVAADRLIGHILADRYQILHRLGEGAMGAVYKARHVRVGRTFAVKVLHARLLQDAKVALRFDREAELAGRLRHANVVGVVDVGEIDGLRYMVMDFAEGPDLAQLLAEAPMPPRRIIHLVRQMLEGLYHAHEQGLIHRDFKPENVIVERDSHGAEMPRIVDFGIAILRDGGESVDVHGRLTTNGLVLGTPHYMAPEQAVADPIDHRIDLFALGIVIYEMLSGRLPFDGSGAEVARANLLLDPPLIAHRVPYLEVDPLLEAFARCLMAKKPAARPPTAKAARELLDLIERDRSAAAAALGVPPGLSGRAPAETTPLVSQPHAAPYGVPVPAETRRLRATPSANEAVPPTAPPVQPAPGTPRAVWMAFSAQRALESQPVPNIAIENDTSVRSPLSWPGTPAMKRRRPLIIAGAAIGAIGIVALVLARTGPPPSAPDEHVVIRPITSIDLGASGASGQSGQSGPGSAPSTTPPGALPTTAEPHGRPPAIPTPTGPSAAAAAPEAPTPTGPSAAAAAPEAPTPTGPSAAAPGPNQPTSPAGSAPVMSGPAAADIRPPAKRPQPPRRAKPQEPRTSESADHDARQGGGGGVVVTDDDDAAPDSRGVAHKTSPRATAKPAEPGSSSVTAISATELSKLWFDVGTQLAKLPRDKSQDLWRRYELLQHGSLMSAPPAQREEAAAALRRIASEASRLSR